MAFNGTGTFLRLYNWVTDKTNSVPITASRVDAEMDGMATGLSSCITKDGQTTITANIPFNSFKATGLGVGTARTDAINVGQVQDNQFLYLGTTSGSADAYTLAPSPTITAYATTQQFTVKISATNLTTTPYLQISSIANPTTTAVIKKLSATKTEIAVEASDLLADGIYEFQRNSANDAWIVLNPEKTFYNLTNGTKASSTVQGILALTPNKTIYLSNNATDATNDIDVSAGWFNFDDGSGQAYYAGGTGQLDIVFGTNNGMLDTGTIANTTYHLFLIYNPTTLISKILASASLASPTLPSGYTKKTRVGSIIRVSGAILPFNQYEKIFTLKTHIVDFNNVANTTTATSRTLTVPIGIKVTSLVYGKTLAGGSSSIETLLTSLDDVDMTPGTDRSNMTSSNATYRYESSVSLQIITNTSGQIRTRSINTVGSNIGTMYLNTQGWIDYQLTY